MHENRRYVKLARSPHPCREHDPADHDGDPCQLDRRRALVHEHDREQHRCDGLHRQHDRAERGRRRAATRPRSAASRAPATSMRASTSQAKTPSQVRSSSSPSSHPAAGSRPRWRASRGRALRRSADIGRAGSEHEQEARVGHGSQQPEENAERGVASVGSRADDAGDQDDADQDDRHGGRAPAPPGARRAAARLRSGRARPARCRAPSRGRRRPRRSSDARGSGRRRRSSPRATRAARALRHATRSGAAPTRRAEQRRQRIGAAVEGGRRRRHVGEPHQDPGERNARRPRQARAPDGPRTHKQAESRTPLAMTITITAARTSRYTTNTV